MIQINAVPTLSWPIIQLNGVDIVEEDGEYVGPLDLVPGAVVAYGQRALSAAKRGTALYTIREDDGDTTQSFSSDATTGDTPVSAITAFLDGATGFVSIWNDQSGNNSHVVQPFPLGEYMGQPSWIADATNSKPGIAFDHASYQFLATETDVSLPNGTYTVFAVIKLVDPLQLGAAALTIVGINFNNSVENVGDFVFMLEQDAPPSTNARYTIRAYSNDYEHGMGYNSSYISIPFEAYLLLDSAVGPFSNSMIKNGTVITPLTDVSFDTGVVDTLVSKLAIGADDASYSNIFSGQIMEVLLYSSILSAANRLAIRQNMATYYGITLA